MRRSAALLTFFVCIGCSTHPAKEISWSSLTSAEQTRALDKIAKRCKLPKDFFERHGEFLTIRPKPTEKYQRVDCALGELGKLRDGPRLGFVGNEAFSDEPQ